MSLFSAASMCTHHTQERVSAAPRMHGPMAASHRRVEFLNGRAENGQQAAQDLCVADRRGVVQRAAAWPGMRLNVEACRGHG